MDTYKRHRFPPEIISYAVWLYYRFNLSHRDVEDLLAERGITVSYESIRYWCIKFGSIYSRRLKRRHQGFGDTFLWMKYLSKLAVFSITFGEPLIKMVKWSMSFFKKAAMQKQQSASSNGYSKITKGNLGRS